MLSLVRSSFNTTHAGSEMENLVKYVFSSISNYNNEIAQVEYETGEIITYKNIMKMANWLGNSLNYKGVKKHEILAILCKNDVDYAWIIFGVLLSGATCALFSSAATPRELSQYFSTIKPTRVIGTELNEHQVKAILLSNVKEIYTDYQLDDTRVKPMSELCCSLEEYDALIDEIKGNDPAFILSSSGSTGNPKGVVLTHANLIEAIERNKNNFMDKNGISLGLMPFYHAYGLGLMLMALCQGSKIITMAKFNLSAFIDAIRIYEISHLYLVPSIVATMGKSDLVTKENLSTVKHVFTGAGSISVFQQQALLNKLGPDSKLYHSYGMTETTFVVIFGEKKPFKWNSCGLINANGEEVDNVGELCLKGKSIMVGYFDNPEATKEAIDELGWLHTGDLVERDEDGYYYIKERLKEMIKYQGQQVSPTQIELALLELDGVDEAAVIGIPHEIYGEVPKAFIVGAKNPPTKEAIIEYVSNQLSSHNHLRGGVEFIDYLPKSQGGKILRKKLKEKFHL